MRTKIICLLVGAYLVDLIYTLVEWDFHRTYSFFPFFHGHSGWDGKMALGTYVYFYCQRVALMMIIWASFLASGFRFFKILFWIELLDLIDFAMCYNEQWFSIRGFSFEFNYLKIGILIYFAAREWNDQQT